ncbi:hypothetical protein M8J75_006559 [Diaphorina citri]|nr:hypothetical protein M8J75_006559 [Diaphorina citri]
MSLKDERWIRNRARYKTSAGSKSPKKLSGPSCNTPPPFLRQQSGVTDGGYTTDNSSECSSSVAPTPLTQSPQHRLYSNASSIHDNSGNYSLVNSIRSPDQDSPSKPVRASHLTLPDCQEELSLARCKATQLRQYSFFQLKIHLKRGRDLIARDKTGTSDPYVKFKISGRLLYKSKTVYRDLNPSWDETFTLPIEDPFEPVQCKVMPETTSGLVVELQVFDYDWGLQDDFMGSASIDLTTLELGRCTDLILTLEDPNKPEENLGDIYLSATLYPRSQEDRDQRDPLPRNSDSPRALRQALGTTRVIPSPDSTDSPVKMSDDSDDELYIRRRKFALTHDSTLTRSLCSEYEALHGSDNILERWGSTLREKSDRVQKYFQRNNKTLELTKRLKNQIWSSVVTIVLIHGKNLLPMDEDGLSDPYVKFRLGQEKYKSKVIPKTLNPSWLEQFDLHMYDDQSQELELTVWDKDRSKDDFMGRCTIDLSCLERETTHKIKKPLEDGGGVISLLLTISGTTASETITDLTSHSENPEDIRMIHERYSLLRAFHRLRDVGHLTVKVYKAQGLAAADLGGKSDPFCVLELVNARLQTQTEYKTLTPVNVKDINSVLEVTVYDEDKDHKVEFLGKLAIPLLRIRNGERRWYALKDKKLTGRAKGNNPQILLEMDVVWNPIRACIRTLNPKEEKYMQTEGKFKRQVFVGNVMRLKVIVMWFYDIGIFLQDCFEWESTLKSLIAVILFIILCYYFEPYMVPIALLLIFLKGYVVQTLLSSHWSSDRAEDDDSGDEEDDEDDKDKEEKKSLKEKLQAIQEVTQIVQNSIGFIASLCESVKNTFNFSVPFVSYLAIFLLILITILLYYVSIRYLIIAWGINKFLRKILRPHTVPNNELLDLLSRVPDNEQLRYYRELRLHPNDERRSRDQRKKTKDR